MQLIVDTIECIEAVIFANALGLPARAKIRSDAEALFDTLVPITEGPTGRHGFGGAPGGAGGGGGGGGRFKTIAVGIPGSSTAGLFALALDGGGGGGGQPGRPVAIYTAADVHLVDPLGGTSLDEVAGLFPRFPITDAILGQLPRGRILTRGGRGGDGSTRGRLTLTTNNVVIKPLLDLIEWPEVDAFQGGGGGGGAGASLTVLAADGIRFSGDPSAHVDSSGGDGGLGGSTVIDPENAHISVREERSELARGARGSLVLNRGLNELAFRAVDPGSPIERGNLVTNRSILRVRFRASSAEPRVVTVRGETGDPRTTLSAYQPDGYHYAEILLSQGFNRLLAGHELLDRVILSLFEDRDGDGLSDADEVALRLDPDNPDTDGDGFTDGFEVAIGSNPRNADGDGDGLPDPEEFALGTSPTDPDTDGDGVYDGAEALLRFDPMASASRPVTMPEGTLLAATAGGFLSVINVATGRLGALGKAAGGLGFGPAYADGGRLVIASFSRLTEVEPFGVDVLGQLPETLIGEFGAPGGAPIRVSQMAYHRGDGALYGVELGPSPDFLETGQLVSIALGTAAATRVGSPGATAIHALAVTDKGDLLATIAGDDATDRLVVLDRDTGAVAEDRGAIGFPNVFGLAVDDSGTLWASAIRARIEGQLLRIDPATGQGAHVVDVDRAVFGLTFAPCPPPCALVLYPVAVGPTSIAALDLNGDERPELVTTNGASLSILLNKGDGTYADAVSVPVQDGSVVRDLTVGDFTGDGLADLAAATRISGRPGVVVFPSRGDGTLRAPLLSTLSSSEGSTEGMAAGDVDRDGDIDLVALVTALPSGERAPRALLNSGSGSFTAGAGLEGLTFPTLLALGDLTGDGTLDLAVVQLTATIAIFRGAGDGSFAPLPGLPGFGTSPAGLALAQLSDDASLDIAVTNTVPAQLEISLGDGGGSFRSRAVYRPAGPCPFRVVEGDLDGDGRADLVTLEYASNEIASLSVFRGRGDLRGTFETAVAVSLPAGFVPGFVLADLDGDGRAEAAFALDSDAGGAVGVIPDLR